jgi:hypothetical protein
LVRESFVHRFIEELRHFHQLVPGSDYANRLATALERRLANPLGDEWDIRISGDDERDRTELIDWLVRSAHTPPYTAPSWTRWFSESAAWLLRHRLSLTQEHLLIAAALPDDADIDHRIATEGAAAVLQDLEARAAEKERQYQEAMRRLKTKVDEELARRRAVENDR